MSADPTQPLFDAILAILLADADVAALLGDRVFDNVETDAAFPYLARGTISTIPRPLDCIDASEARVVLHVWSRAVGQAEASAIVAAVRAALHLSELTPSGFNPCELTLEAADVAGDPDGATTHAILTFRALLEPAA